MNDKEEWYNLLHECWYLAQRWGKSNAASRIIMQRGEPELVKQIALLFSESLHFEAPFEDDKAKKDCVRMKVWGKFLSSPIEELPTLMGLDKKMDELIAERMKA